MEEVLNDDRVFNEIISRVNREHNILKKNAYKEQSLQEKEREKLENRVAKNHEAYEDGLITKEEFLNRKYELDMQREQIRERINENHLILFGGREEGDTERSCSGDSAKFQCGFIQRHRSYDSQKASAPVDKRDNHRQEHRIH